MVTTSRALPSGDLGTVPPGMAGKALKNYKNWGMAQPNLRWLRRAIYILLVILCIGFVLELIIVDIMGSWSAGE